MESVINNSLNGIPSSLSKSGKKEQTRVAIKTNGTSAGDKSEKITIAALHTTAVTIPKAICALNPATNQI